MSEDPRYVAGLQDTTEKELYKDFFESNKLEETKQKADEQAEKYQRTAIVFDRRFGIVYKKEINVPGAVKVQTKVIPVKVVEPVVNTPKRRGRPPKKKPDIIAVQSSNDDYF